MLLPTPPSKKRNIGPASLDFLYDVLRMRNNQLSIAEFGKRCGMSHFLGYWRLSKLRLRVSKNQFSSRLTFIRVMLTGLSDRQGDEII